MTVQDNEPRNSKPRSTDRPEMDLSGTTVAAISLPKRAALLVMARPNNVRSPDGDATSLPGGRSDMAPILAPEDLGYLVRRAREDLKLSQQSFADLSGVGRRFISELENGKPTLEFGKVLKVAHAAGISLFARPR